MFALAPGAGGGGAVDLSCGAGRYTRALAERGVRVVGVDLSAPMLARARARAERSGLAVGLVRADAGALPFRAGVFDLATIVLGLEFAAAPGRVLDEACRVLKPGGRLVVAILSRVGLWTLWRRLKRAFAPSIWREARFFGLDELRGLLRARGFVELRWRSAVHFVPIFRERGLGWLERWETLGVRWMPSRASFVAVAARRP